MRDSSSSLEARNPLGCDPPLLYVTGLARLRRKPRWIDTKTLEPIFEANLTESWHEVEH